MTIINKLTKTLESQSHRKSNWMGEDWIAVPPNLEATVWASAPYCDLTIEDGILVDVTPLERPEPVLTPEEQIAPLKAQLTATDYKAMKFAEGWLTAEEYAPIKAERQVLRDEINRLEATQHEENPTVPL